MKKAKTVILIILSAAVLAAVAVLLYMFVFSKNFSDNPKAINEASSSVVLLDCYDKNNEPYCTGSAFAAFEDGIFVTNYHVIQDEVYSIVARTEEGISFEMNSVLAYDKEKDIAILKTNSNPHIMPLTFGDANNLEKGEKVVAIGSPLGFIN